MRSYLNLLKQRHDRRYQAPAKMFEYFCHLSPDSLAVRVVQEKLKDEGSKQPRIAFEVTYIKILNWDRLSNPVDKLPQGASEVNEIHHRGATHTARTSGCAGYDSIAARTMAIAFAMGGTTQQCSIDMMVMVPQEILFLLNRQADAFFIVCKQGVKYCFPLVSLIPIRVL